LKKNKEKRERIMHRERKKCGEKRKQKERQRKIRENSKDNIKGGNGRKIGETKRRGRHFN